MAFHVGQRVVCVDDRWTRRLGHLIPRYPKEDEIFTIRGIRIALDINGAKGAGLSFQEIICGIAGDGGEASFAAENFRPVVERKTDISIIEALLIPANHKQLELT
jgi:hypothetical protein